MRWKGKVAGVKVRAAPTRIHLAGSRCATRQPPSLNVPPSVLRLLASRWHRQYPGHEGPEYQPRGTDWQLPPAHHGRAAVRALWRHSTAGWMGAGVQWILRP